MLVAALLAVCASVLLSSDCDGLPFFDDNDADSDGLSVVVRVAHAALPPATAELALSRAAIPLVAATGAALPDPVPSRLLPSRSPPRT